METVSGKITDLQQNTATVVVRSLPACARCAAGRGCGAGLLQTTDTSKTLLVDIPNGAGIRVGDSVELSISESHLLRAALLAYGVPLMTTMGALIVGQLMHGAGGVDDATAISLAVGGLFAGFVLSRVLLGRRALCRQFVPVLGRAAFTMESAARVLQTNERLSTKPLSTEPMATASAVDSTGRPLGGNES